MTIYVIDAAETNDMIPGLSFSPPVLITATDFSVGMERNAQRQRREACENDEQRHGWDVAQSMKEL